MDIFTPEKRSEVMSRKRHTIRLTIDELRSGAAALPVDAFSYAGVNRRNKLLILDRM